MSDNNYTPSAREISAIDYKMAEVIASETIVVLSYENGDRTIGFHSASLDGIAAEWSEHTVEDLEAVARRMLDLAARMKAGAL